MNKMTLVKKVQEILDSRCEDPGDQMVKEGEALAAIGRTLKGVSLADARAIIRAVSALEGVGDKAA